MIEPGRQIAAHVLEAAAADIEFRAGRFVIAGTDRSVGIMELAAKIHAGLELPPGLPQSLDVADIYDGPPSAFPNGCHIAEVEVDPETGMVDGRANIPSSTISASSSTRSWSTARRMAASCRASARRCASAPSTTSEGQLLTGSYMDYAMPRADDAPLFAHESHPVPATTNPLGAKGCGEAGCAGALPSVMNALVDALGEFGIRHIDMPATPERVWRAIRDARI